mmetsp:Transcript_54169/g.128990  ORF Transcript_54169/g.128990 Transcript_54169/m.128990 type:complete len:264 (-) Transcript_54169:454-1245(-)
MTTESLSDRCPGKCRTKKFTVSKMPNNALARSPAFCLASSCDRSLCRTPPNPNNPSSSAQKRTHFRALSCKRRLESPSLSTRCGTSVSKDNWRSSSESTPATLTNASMNKSYEANLTGMTLSFMTMLSSWQQLRQHRTRSLSFKPVPIAPVEPGFAMPWRSSPLRTAPMDFKACARWSHFDDCTDCAIIGPKASLMDAKTSFAGTSTTKSPSGVAARPVCVGSMLGGLKDSAKPVGTGISLGELASIASKRGLSVAGAASCCC